MLKQAMGYTENCREMLGWGARNLNANTGCFCYLHLMGAQGGKHIQVRVYCYAGYRGEQEPRAFELSGGRLEVREILDRWLAPDHRYFKVRAGDGGVYILRHDENADAWELTMFQGRGSCSAGRKDG